MNDFASRSSSIDKIDINEWRWGIFLDYAINSFSRLNPKPIPLPKEFLYMKSTIGSKANPQTVITITWACRTEKFRYVRAACIEAGPFVSVLNFVAIPDSKYDLPFFGADFVSLPSGHLIALDLQPVLKNDKQHTLHIWKVLVPLHRKWKAELPDGGEIPDSAKSYFSPGFLWTRFPMSEKSNQRIVDEIYPAFREYLNLYMDFQNQAELVDIERCKLLLSGQKNYLKYREEKDPAKSMLKRFYGSEWTDSYLKQVLFPF